MIDIINIFEEVYSREHMIPPDIEPFRSSSVQNAAEKLIKMAYEDIKDQKYDDEKYGKFINAAAICSKSNNEILTYAIADKDISHEQISKELGFQYKKYGEPSYRPNGHAEALACIQAMKRGIDPSKCYVIIAHIRRFKDPFVRFGRHVGKNATARIKHQIKSGQIENPFAIKVHQSTPCNNCHHCLNDLGYKDVYFTGATTTLPEIKLFKLSDTEKNRNM